MTTPTPTNCPICNGPMPCLKHFRAYADARSQHVGSSPERPGTGTEGPRFVLIRSHTLNRSMHAPGMILT